MILDIYTDGASRGNPGFGAGGFYVETNKLFDVEIHNNVTNNRMEFLGVSNALNYVESMFDEDINNVNIYTDSQLVVGIFSMGWNCNANIDLYDLINHKINFLNCIRNIKINFIKVKGHSGNTDGNYIIDMLLNKAMDANKNISGMYNLQGLKAL